MTPDPAQWVKARRSSANGQCVELRRHDAAVEVRDTKAHGLGPSLRMNPAAFAAWLDAAKSGELDHLT
jgi:hypothetical protein